MTGFRFLPRFAALIAVFAALAIPASGTSAIHNAPIGDGGGGACTPAIAGQTFVMDTTMWSYAWMYLQHYWSWGLWGGTRWYCDGHYWYDLPPY